MINVLERISFSKPLYCRLNQRFCSPSKRYGHILHCSRACREEWSHFILTTREGVRQKVLLKAKILQCIVSKVRENWTWSSELGADSHSLMHCFHSSFRLENTASHFLHQSVIKKKIFEKKSLYYIYKLTSIQPFLNHLFKYIISVFNHIILETNN